MSNLVGRRVATIGDIVRPGDYCGPIRGYTGPVEACFFLLPIAGGDNPLWRHDPEHPGNGLHHVAFPPHTYRECADGSLEIRASIGAHGPGADGTPYTWHGYLDEGSVWREC